jgi:hypothetical protein
MIWNIASAAFAILLASSTAAAAAAAFAANNDDCHDYASCTYDAVIAPRFTTIKDGAFERCALDSVTMGLP